MDAQVDNVARTVRFVETTATIAFARRIRITWSLGKEAVIGVPVTAFDLSYSLADGYLTYVLEELDRNGTVLSTSSKDYLKVSYNAYYTLTRLQLLFCLGGKEYQLVQAYLDQAEIAFADDDPYSFESILWQLSPSRNLTTADCFLY